MTARPLRGIHVFWMIAFFFLLVIAVDTFFIVRAIATFPGEQVKKSYVMGLDYNREIESRQRQADLGWTAQAGIHKQDGLALVVRVADKSLAPVSGLEVFAAYHTAGAGRDEQTVVLAELSPGEYRASLDLSPQSRVEFNIKARRRGDEEAIFQAGKTLVTP